MSRSWADRRSRSLRARAPSSGRRGAGFRTWHALIAAGATACGAGSEPARIHDREDAEVMPPASDVGGGTGPDVAPAFDARVPLSVALPGPPGSVAATLEGEGSSRVHVESYPGQAELSVRHGPLPLDYEGAFSEPFCADVSARANLARQGSTLAQQARQQVRADGAVVADLTVYPLIGPGFERAVREAARAAGVAAGSLQIDNPVKLDDAELALQLSSTATSLLIGETEQLASTLRSALAAQRATALQSGSFQLALSAKDLWCDLAQGRASVVIHLRGSVGGSTFAGQTKIAGVEPLAASP